MKKITAMAMGLFLIFAVSAGTVKADSMLTSPPTYEYSDGLLIVGDESFDQLNSDSMGGEVMFVTLKGKMDKIWGPESVRQKMAQPQESLDYTDTPAHLPQIMVAMKNTSTSYKYRHLYSSRGSNSTGNNQASHINITPIIVGEARRFNICPMLLKAVIQTESNYKNYAVSHAGAMGLGQLMPATARYLGCKDPFDPVENIRAAAKYLSMLKKMFHSTDLVLAAYNAGPGTVSRSGNRIPNIAETRRYVQKVRKNMHWKN